MQLIKRQANWNPFREIEELSTRFNRLFGNLQPWTDGDKEALATTDWAPSCDISETDKEYKVRAELPAMKKDDVHVSVDKGILTIQGERKEEKEEKGEKFHRRELSYGTFVRRFTMPEDADETKVDAKFKDGMLEVSIPKSKQKPKAREIAVH